MIHFFWLRNVDSLTDLAENHHVEWQQKELVFDFRGLLVVDWRTRRK